LKLILAPNLKLKLYRQRRKRKKYYDNHGNEITDETLLQGVARGATVYRYHEQKSDEEKRHIIRSLSK
jgi:hypothetical protein